MSTDTEILSRVRIAFGSCKRPAHFTNYKHCEECLEHDELLRARDLDSLTIADVGNPGWNPIPFTTPAAFGYYFPALVRLSLDEPDDFYGWYFRELLFFLTYEDTENQHLHHFTPDEQQAVVAFLRHVAATRRQLFEEHCCEVDFQKTLSLWTHPNA